MPVKNIYNFRYLTVFSIEKNYIFGKVIQFPTFLVFYSSQDSLCKCLKISMQVDGCLFFQFSIASNVPKETLIFVHSPIPSQDLVSPLYPLVGFPKNFDETHFLLMV